MKRIAVLTSGGDAPGMNAVIRAVARMGAANGLEVLGVKHGYTGLIAGDFMPLGPRDVGGIMERGGTVLGTTRCVELKSDAGQDKALASMRAHRIDGLVVIGGNGSQTGARALHRKGLAVVGVASTIDNDLAGTDVSIGATTAIDIALESVDRLRVTAASHQRIFLVEVMGRDCGYLASVVGLASGAEVIVVPELPSDPEAVAQDIRAGAVRGKHHAIVIVAEGAAHDAEALAQYFQSHRERLQFDFRVCRLGHVQRGGAPGVADRLLATRLGAAAAEALASGRHGVLLGVVAGEVLRTPLEQVAQRTNPLGPEWLALAHALAQ